jgi:hypothetical protein
VIASMRASRGGYAGASDRRSRNQAPGICGLAVARANIDAGLIEGAIYPGRVDDGDVRFAGDQFLDRDSWSRTHCPAEGMAAGSGSLPAARASGASRAAKAMARGDD